MKTKYSPARLGIEITAALLSVTAMIWMLHRSLAGKSTYVLALILPILWAAWCISEHRISVSKYPSRNWQIQSGISAIAALVSTVLFKIMIFGLDRDFSILTFTDAELLFLFSSVPTFSHQSTVS
jgi:hypothetical protein